MELMLTAVSRDLELMLKVAVSRDLELMPCRDLSHGQLMLE